MNILGLSDQQMELYLYLKEIYPGRVHISDITNDRPLGGLGIKGYSERFTELRQKGFVIKNLAKNYYRIEGEPNWNTEQLREIYRKARVRGYKSLMKRCEKKAEDISLVKNVAEALC